MVELALLLRKGGYWIFYCCENMLAVKGCWVNYLYLRSLLLVICNSCYFVVLESFLVLNIWV